MQINQTVLETVVNEAINKCGYQGNCNYCTPEKPQYHTAALSVYACPNGHELFYSRALNGAVYWGCPDCHEAGDYLGCDGEGHSLLRDARPVRGQLVKSQAV